MRYPFYFQLDSFDCGPTCLKMVAEYYGKQYSLDYLRENCFITREGASLLGVSQAATDLGLETVVGKVCIDDLNADFQLPAILHWNQEHFVVLYKVRRKTSWLGPLQNTDLEFVVGDPAHGIITIGKEAFVKHWQPDKAGFGIGLFLLPGEAFYQKPEKKTDDKAAGFLFRYLSPFRKQIALLGCYLVLITAIGISFPYLTKNLVDKGIGRKNYSLILLFTVSQLILFLSSTILDIFRGWLVLKINTKISIRIVSDFLAKLLQLPIRFFDSKSVGDIAQRINDHHRIEAFLTGDAINSVFSVIQILTFSFILLSYNTGIWAIFASLSILGILWIFLFQKKRKHLDYVRFGQNKLMQEKLYEMVVGMQDIKLNGSEDAKRVEWEQLQQKVFELNKRSLQLEQFRQTGFSFFNYVKNIVISFLAAVAIIDNKLSLGEMLSISFIIGQTNGPLSQLIEFFRSVQDARLSLDRLQEVQQKENEEKPAAAGQPVRKITERDSGMGKDILLQNVSFQYHGPLSKHVLKDINLRIPRGKVTAIVGASGSGKTTLMKLLLGFYHPTQGRILIGNEGLDELSPKWWRTKCGTVMQDGYIFYDSILRNICLSLDEIDEQRLNAATAISHVDEFVNQLPMRYNTRIGSSGIGLSGGQKQRILIARAIYRNPRYLFFDEATSSLDTHNEKGIMENLQTYFKGRTVVIIAHRLSTVKNADKIVVLEKGEIIEEGTHFMLASQKKKYFELVKEQLELGA
jgi:ATP-binding cassette subfamily B protein